jgi:hypothetical protein
VAARERRKALRGALIARLLRLVPNSLLAGLCLLGLALAYAGAADTPLAPWRSVDALATVPSGSQVWIEGELAFDGPGLDDPCAEQKVVAYRLGIRRDLRHLAWDEERKQMVGSVRSEERSVERAVPGRLRDATGEVEVRDLTVGGPADLVLRWHQGEPLPPTVRTMPELFSVVPGETLVGFTIDRNRLRGGDRVAVYGAVGRLGDGRTIIQAPSGASTMVLEGGYLAWRSRIARATVPWIGMAALSALALAMLGSRRKGASARSLGGTP